MSRRVVGNLLRLRLGIARAANAVTGSFIFLWKTYSPAHAGSAPQSGTASENNSVFF